MKRFVNSLLFSTLTVAAFAAPYHQYTESKGRPITLPYLHQLDDTEVCDKCGLRHHPLISERSIEELWSDIPTDSVINDYYSQFPPTTFEPLIYSGFRPGPSLSASPPTTGGYLTWF